MMNNKKAVSAVIATSLIVLITVAAVAILWTAVMPIIRTSVPGNDACMGVTPNLEILSACKSGSDVKITVKQTSDATITGFKFYPYDAAGVVISATDDATGLAKNVEKVFTVTSAGTNGATIAIAPVVAGKTCESTAKKVVAATC